ncbi:hypothetical protein [Clostridium perfringens]|uniref:hypothetical protein n=2 Tax=Clostridium perfringens TaxID=1502 RepID=UPI0024BC9FE0|nr:hypothetical protein [Clostridium perfringens]
MDRLIAYNQLEDLRFLDEKNEFSFIITAYRETSTILNKILKIKSISINEIIDNIFEGWRNKEKQYSNIVEIRKFLDSIENENLKKRFSKLSNEIYYMIKSYKELGIEIEDYGEFSLNDEENLFLEIMKILYIEENFIDFDIKIYNYNKNIEKFKDDLISVIKKVFGNNFEEIFNKTIEIYIQGFYYITPMQEIIFQFLNKCGFKIIPLICFDKNNQKVNEIIFKTFNSYNVYSIGDFEGDDNKLHQIFAKKLDNKFVNSTNDSYKSENIKIKIYDNLNRYNKDIIKNNKNIYAVNSSLLVDRLSVLGGQFNKNKKISIKFYPIGIFLNEIYSMWDKNRREIVFNIDSFCKIFETGILKSDSGNSSKLFLEELKLISNYFIDCKTLNDFIERLNLLKKNIKGCSYKEFKEYYGPFSVELSILDEIYNIISKIHEITNTIFVADDYDLEIENHLKNLKNIIENNVILEEDNLIICELLKKVKEIILKRNRKINISISNNYLNEAINFYINDIEKEDESKYIVNLLPIDAIESISNETKDIIVTDFDRDNFPNKKNTNSIFLNIKKLELMKNNKENSKDRKIIDRQIILLRDNALIGRYIFWLLLKSPVNKIISRLEKDKNNAHFYEVFLRRNNVEVLKDIKEPNIENIKKNIDLKSYKLKEKKKYDTRVIHTKYCPLRGFYYRINGDSEVYSDNFLVEHSISHLFYTILKKYESNFDRRKEILDKLLMLLPQYSSIEKGKFRGTTIKFLREDKHKCEKNEDWGKLLKEDIEKFFQEKFSVRDRNNIWEEKITPLPISEDITCKYCTVREMCNKRYIKSNLD